MARRLPQIRLLILAAAVGLAVESGCVNRSGPEPTGKSAEEGPEESGGDRASTSPKPVRRALLVGVTRYPNLDPFCQLIGPGNDVVLIDKLLREKFRFRRENIVILSEEEGDENPEKLPTRANIRREFRRLAEQSRSGDRVVILMAGHGSQEPADADPQDPEPDGLDEIFLPRDAGNWVEDADRGAVENAIVDDEIRQWLEAIRARGASLWVILDACHSGTMTRGIGERVRRVPMEWLQIPEDATAGTALADRPNPLRSRPARTSASEPPPLDLADRPASPGPPGPAEPGGIVALYACQPTEVTVEKRLPIGSAEKRYYGLLSHTISQVLIRATESSTRPITYRELVQRVQSEYDGMGRRAPTPLLEGNDRDREVLGDTTWPGRSNILLGKDLEISAGAVHGLTAGSILQVLPPAGQGDDVVGHLRVAELRMADARVEPCEYAGLPVPADLPAGARCRPVYVDYGDQRLRVAVDARDDRGIPVPEARRQRLVQRMEALGGDGSLVEIVGEAQGADFLVRPASGALLLVPAAEAFGAESAGTSPLFGPFEDDDPGMATLGDNLNGIWRAHNLKRLARQLTVPSPGQPAPSGDDVQVKVDVWRSAGEGNTEQRLPIRWQRRGLTLYDQDEVVAEITNPCTFPIDATVLYVDSEFGITSLFPQGEYNRLEPDESRAIRIEIMADTWGLEHLVVIAVTGSGPLTDFANLEQSSVESFRDFSSGSTTRSAETPLDRLLEHAMRGKGTTRGSTRGEREKYTMALVSWHISPDRRPGETD